MVAVYVTLSATVVPTTKSRVYALLLPDDTTWAEVDVQPSERAGFGLFPKMASDGCWSNASNVPIALPYIMSPASAQPGTQAKYTTHGAVPS